MRASGGWSWIDSSQIGYTGEMGRYALGARNYTGDKGPIIREAVRSTCEASLYWLWVT